jgi:hypothetical protein
MILVSRITLSEAIAAGIPAATEPVMFLRTCLSFR